MKLNQRSVFDLTHERKFSCDMGKLIPILCEEILPGDSFRVKTDMLVRVAPMLAPVMHRISAFTHYFFVPTRILHSNWESFITGGVDGKDATVPPYITSPVSTGWALGSLADYFGLPTGVAGLQVSAYPFRAYAKIFDEWYRDQTLMHDGATGRPVISLADGSDTTTSTALLSRCWEKDYFTKCLPWTQRGDAVTVGIGGEALVKRYDSSNVSQLARNKGSQTLTPGATNFQVKDDGTGKILSSVGGQEIHLDPNGTLYADLGTSTPVSINTLRQAFQVQKWMEKNARGGARYVEQILAHWGIRSSDARLQRPEFLAGGRSPIVISEVLQTSKGETGSPQGNMAGHGFSAQRSHQFVKSFEEHGYVIGIMSIMPRTAYQQGIPRMWSRTSRLDYAFPEFAHLGEQAVLMKELYATGDSGDDNTPFGYVPRYEEYRRRASTVHGDFRDTLAYWHMGRIWSVDEEGGGDPPELNDEFVRCVPTKRIVAAEDEHACWVQLLNQVQAARLLPKSGVPGLVDH